ncbi:MAG: 2-hydroxyacyl-CoA dehydratase [Deltaproteobacteria bacterium]|nr:2-hydroxyacyl-CoA dehydratase [Deltaproteobacteria bacterium]
MYTNLFKMVGFSEDEIKEQKPRIEKLLDRIGVLDKESIKHAEEHTRKNFDTEMAGTRKFLHLLMLEFMAAVLAREENEKVIHSNMPLAAPMTQAMQEAVIAKNAPIYVGSALTKCWLPLGSIFDKVNELIEVGELMGMTAGRAHCSHYHILGGLYEKGIIPLPDICVSASQYCDQSAESDALLSNTFGYPVTYVDGVNDWNWESWPELEERGVNYIKGKLLESYGVVKEVTGLEVGPESIFKGFEHNAKITMSWQGIVQMMAKADPQPVSQADLSLCHHSWSPACNMEKLQIDAFNTMMKDVHKRTRKGIGVVPKGAPRIYMQLRTSVDMTPMRVVEESGLAIPLMMFDMVVEKMLPPGGPPGMPPGPGGPPGADGPPPDMPDPLVMTAEFLYKLPQFSDVPGYIDYVEELSRACNADGVLLIFQFNCRPWATPPLMAKRALKERLGVPVLVVEGDIYDTRNYSAGQLKTRIESFAEVLKAQKLGMAA